MRGGCCCISVLVMWWDDGIKVGVEEISSRVRLPKEVFSMLPFIWSGVGAEVGGLSMCWSVHDVPWIQKPCSRYLGQIAAMVFWIHPDTIIG